jgi:O-antigen ligase
LLCSKAGIISLMISFIVIFLYLILQLRKYILGIYLLSAATILLLILFKLFPLSIQRMYIAKEALANKSQQENSLDGSMNRVMIWETSLDIIKEHFFWGTGTGDVKDVLISKYKEKNITNAINKKLNAHNQFLQTFIATGFIGFVILILCLLLPALKTFRERDILYFLFIIIIGFNFMFESMLEVQAGVVFYGFFNSMLFFKSSSNH